jgi:hypothetical protein
MGGDDEDTVNPTEERDGLDTFPFLPLAKGISMLRAARKYPRESVDSK